jgi:hypothetical protein
MIQFGVWSVKAKIKEFTRKWYGELKAVER